MKIRRVTALLTAVAILIAAGFCAFKIYHDSQLKNKLLSKENNVSITTLKNIRIIVVNKNYFQNEKGDRIISRENVKVRLVERDGPSKYIDAYGDSGNFLSFILPSSYTGILFIEFVKPEEYEEKSDEESNDDRDYIEKLTKEITFFI
jgi:hypothetical protein